MQLPARHCPRVSTEVQASTCTPFHFDGTGPGRCRRCHWAEARARTVPSRGYSLHCYTWSYCRAGRHRCRLLLGTGQAVTHRQQNGTAGALTDHAVQKAQIRARAVASSNVLQLAADFRVANWIAALVSGYAKTAVPRGPEAVACQTLRLFQTQTAQLTHVAVVGNTITPRVGVAQVVGAGRTRNQDTLCG